MRIMDIFKSLEHTRTLKPVYCSKCVHHFRIVADTGETVQHVCLANTEWVGDAIYKKVTVSGWVASDDYNKENDCTMFRRFPTMKYFTMIKAITNKIHIDVMQNLIVKK